MVRTDRPTVHDLKLAAYFLIGKSPKEAGVYNKGVINAELYYEIFEKLTLFKNSPDKKELFNLANEFHVSTGVISRLYDALTINGWTGERVFKNREIKSCKGHIRGTATCSRLKYINMEA